MLAQLVNHHFVRYAAVAAALAASAPAYAQTSAPEYTSAEEQAITPTENQGAYYIDQAKRKEKKRKEEEKKAEEKPAYLQETPTTPDYPGSTSAAGSPTPRYVQPSSPEYENPVQKAASKVLWGIILATAVTSVIAGFELEMDWCNARDQQQQSTCEKNNRDLRYVMIGGGTLLAAMGLWGVLK